jgi:hypothetical protein
LQGKVPYSTIYSQVKAAREKGTYNKEIRRAEEKKIGAVIEITDNDSASSGNISLVTMTTAITASSSSGKAGNSTTNTSLSSELRKQPRQSSKQASVARLKAKRVLLDYDTRYKAAFKDANNLVAAAAANNTTARYPVQNICDKLNRDFMLDGKKRLTISTVYQAAKDGLAGMNPKARGPPAKIPKNFMKLVATHSEVSQVCDGELKGKDFKRLIGASIVHETRFKAESVWRKVRVKFPEALQASTRLMVEDARAQWTTFDNLNQWFDDVKKDLLKTGLVLNQQALNDECSVVSEVMFRKDTERCIINMDKTHHDLNITEDKGGPRAVS